MIGRRSGFGSVIRRKDDGRWGIQWTDAGGVRRWERLPDTTVDRKPLTERSIVAEGRRRLGEYQEKARRQRHGLEPMPSEALGLPFGALFDWWWTHHGRTLRSSAVGPFLRKHLGPLGAEPMRDLTPARVRRLLVEKSSALAPKSVNNLRGYLHNIFAVCRERGGPWEGRPNPVAEVKPMKASPRPKRVLQADEFERVLAEVPEEWRGPTAVGLYAGLREGEIFGLLKADVDLERGSIMVWRSWDSPRTKDGKALPVPVAPQLRPRLERAMLSPGPLAFPAEGGRMHSRKLRLTRMLRAAVARAGLLDGWEHRCLAAHCGWRSPGDGPEAPEACPRCGEPATWAKPIPRHVTFHGTRHSFATAVVRSAGVAVAQRLLRHSDVRLTIQTYGHLDDGDLRAGVAAAFGAAAELRTPETGAPSPAVQPAEGPGTAGGSVRTGGRTAPSAASARTRCSSAA